MSDTKLLRACLEDNTDVAKQYDSLAKKYSEMVVEKDDGSITAYFRYLDMPMHGKRVLDVGCGDGYDLSRIKKKGASIFGIDSSEEMVKLALRRDCESTIELGYFDNIPFEDRFFDVVVSKWALQLAENMDSVYREIARVLKPDGQFIYLSAHPMRQFMDKKSHVRNYFKNEIVEAVFFDGQLIEKAPSHTMNEYLSPTFFESFSLVSYEERYDEASEKIQGDIYPGYFIVQAKRLQ